jgi:nitroimidazol reductase NimA-like FMN-containing flavoprotein (pyridoxamine 5'-phosphate oxidase superfamily)
MDADAAREIVRKVLTEQKLGVLATAKGNEPYQSLVAIAATEDLGAILFATCRPTRKHANLMANPNVALLIDSTANAESDFHDAAAVTAVGAASAVEGAGRGALRALYLARHPYLADFLESPDCALFCIRVRTYHVVTEFQKVVRLDLPG